MAHLTGRPPVTSMRDVFDARGSGQDAPDKCDDSITDKLQALNQTLEGASVALANTLAAIEGSGVAKDCAGVKPAGTLLSSLDEAMDAANNLATLAGRLREHVGGY